MPGGAPDNAIKQHEQRRQEARDQRQRQQRSAGEQEAQAGHRRHAGRESQREARSSQDAGRHEQRRERFAQRKVCGLARRDASTVTQVMRGQQNAVVDGGAQLHRVDDEVADEVHRLAHEVRDRQVDPDARLDGEQQHERQRERAERHQQHDEDGDDGYGADHHVVHRHDVLHVVEIRGLAGGVVRVVMARSRLLHGFHRGERLVAFHIGAGVGDDARVVRRIELVDHALVEEALRDGGAHGGRVRDDARYMIDLGQVARKRSLGGHVTARHQHHHGVLLAELVLDHKRVGAGAQVRVGLAVLVGEHGVALTQKSGNDERQHEDESRDAHLRQHLAHVLERGHERPMPRLVDELVQRKRDRRQEHHDGEEAEHNALHQVDAKIGADLELHERKSGETEQRGDGAGGDGGQRPAHSQGHGTLHARRAPTLGRERVQQEDGVVQRHRQLQDGAHRERDERNLTQHDVRTHVDENGNADGGDEQQRLDPRRGGQHEQQDDDGHEDERRAAGLLRRAGRGLRGIGGLARHGVARARLVHEGAQRGDGRAFGAFGHGDLEQRSAIAIVRLDGGGVGHLEGHGDVDDVVEPHDALDAFHFGDLMLERKRLGNAHVVDEHIGVGDGLGELVVHDGDGRGGLRFVGQVVHHVVVDSHERDHRGTHDGDGQKRRHDGFASRDDAVDDAIHTRPPVRFACAYTRAWLPYIMHDNQHRVAKQPTRDARTARNPTHG